MLQKKYIGMVLLLLVAVSASAQKAERDYIRKGNRFFKDSVYVDAEVNYRKALEVNPKSTVSMFNLGNTLTQQNKLQEAMEQYVGATKIEKDKSNLAQIYHNMGVIFHSQKDYAKAVEAIRSRYAIIRKMMKRAITLLWHRNSCKTSSRTRIRIKIRINRTNRRSRINSRISRKTSNRIKTSNNNLLSRKRKIMRCLRKMPSSC